MSLIQIRPGFVRTVALVLGIVLAGSLPALAVQPGGAERDATQAGDIEVTFEATVTGVSSPMHMAEAPDGSGRLFIVNNAGVVRVFADGQLLGEPFLDITDLVDDQYDESGLFSITFHPQYADNGLFFVSFTSTEQTNAVMRFSVSADDPNQADPASSVSVLDIPDEVPAFHNGGGLEFGPDGYLYITMGDDTLEENPQSLLSWHGKLLRIDPLTGPVGPGEPAYVIPPDNPFVDRDDALPEIWAYGLRNPWRATFDRETGDLYTADVGQDDWEEVNFQPAGSPGGENYGWNIMEGNHCFPPDSECDPEGLAPPVGEYSHDDGCAVIGGYVYRGTASPALYGKYLFADICSGILWGLQRDENGEWQQELLAETNLTISSFAEDEHGELYVVTFQNGAVRRIVADGHDPEDSPAFDETWARSDGPVAGGDVARSWIWGPLDDRDVRVERYDEAPGGVRTVVYFDKSRMEITYPDGDQESPWYVTNGLLVAEMIVGRVQIGDDLYEPREPAGVNVAGDPDDPDSPTYASFRDLLDEPPLPFDQAVIQRLDRDGVVTSDEGLSGHGVMIEAIDEATGHAIAGPFWEFMNSEGPIMVDGQLQSGPLFPDPVFATGRPITEPYWTNVAVAGTDKLVLVQCFERRCLTYTPDNPEDWQVEAGNVGQHYKSWRYGE